MENVGSQQSAINRNDRHLLPQTDTRVVTDETAEQIGKGKEKTRITPCVCVCVRVFYKKGAAKRPLTHTPDTEKYIYIYIKLHCSALSRIVCKRRDSGDRGGVRT